MPLERALAGVLLLAALAASVGCASGPSPTSRTAAGETEAETSAVAQRSILSAEALLAQDDAAAALAEVQAALRMAPRSARARIVHGRALEALGRDDDAGEAYERAFALAPRSGPVLNAYGAWLCRSGRIDAALEAFSNATLDEAYRTPEQALANAASCAAEAGRLDWAEMNFRAALALSPINPQALFGLSRLEKARGNVLNARAFLQRREALGPLGAAEVALAIEIEKAAGDVRALARYRDQLAALQTQIEAASPSPAPRSPNQ